MSSYNDLRREKIEKINNQLDELRVRTLKALNQELLNKHLLDDPNFLKNEGSRWFTFRSAPGVSVPIEFVDERTNYGWRSEPNGKCRIYVGDYGDKQCFRTKKGEFDVPVIAHHIAARLKQTAERVREQRAQAEEKRVYDDERTKLVSQYSLSEYTSTIESKPSGLIVKLAGLSGEQANKILELATSLGVKL